MPDSNDRVVLFEYGAGAGADQNLVRIDPRGNLRWRAELPEWDAADAYVDVGWEGGTLTANSWSAYLVELDPETGRIRSKTWTK